MTSSCAVFFPSFLSLKQSVNAVHLVL